MNIYDFDNTIIKGDSSVKFIKYSLIHHPLILSWSMIKALKEVVKKFFSKSDLGKIKSELFSFVKYIDNLDSYLDTFVIKCQKDIKKFYLEQQKDNDLVISASFDFIIKPLCQSLGIKNVIATKYNIQKGCIIGENCKGEEKVKRLKKEYDVKNIVNAYSDSLSDIPMLNLAKNAFLVKDEELIKYNKNSK